MATQPLKHRTTTKDTPTSTTTNTNTNTNTSGDGSSKRDSNKKMAMAKRGLRSLSLAIALPLILKIFIMILTGSGHKYSSINPKPFWYPPLWVLNFAVFTTFFLMGLSAWLVWAEGGFHRQPAALPLFVSQLLFSLLWDPIVFNLGMPHAGLLMCLGLFVSLVAWLMMFRSVNPTAVDLIKPCLAWVVYLTVVNYKLIHLS